MPQDIENQGSKTPVERTRSRMRFHVASAALLFGLGAAALLGNNPPAEAVPVRQVVHRPVLTAYGSVEPSSKTTIPYPTGLVPESVSCRPGDSVSVGQTCAVLDRSRFSSAISRAIAVVEADEAEMYPHGQQQPGPEHASRTETQSPMYAHEYAGRRSWLEKTVLEGDSHLASPVAGIVLSNDGVVGQPARPGAAIVVGETPVVVLSVSEKNLKAFPAGARVSVGFPSEPELEVVGVVESTIHSGQARPDFSVHIAIQTRDLRVPFGSRAVVKTLLDPVSTTLVAPTGAVTHRPGETAGHVRLVRGEKTWLARVVVLNETAETTEFISDEVVDGDLVAVAPQRTTTGRRK
jgi:multidrug resistance efflux pump